MATSQATVQAVLLRDVTKSHALSHVSTGHVLLSLSLFFYLLLVALFSSGASENILYGVSLLALVSSVSLMRVDFIKALYLVILVTHIGPIIRISVPFLGMAHLGDIFILFLTIFFIPRMVRRGLVTGPYRGFIIPFAFLVFINFILSADPKVAAPGVISLLQLATIYFVTLTEVRTRAQATNVINALAFAVFISALMHLYFYMTGRSLLLRLDDMAMVIPELQGAYAIQYIKTSFFYGSFIASCVATIVIGFRHIFLTERFNFYFLVLWIVGTVVVVASALVQSTRTGLLSSALVAAVCILISLKRAINGGARRLLRWVAGVVAFVIILGGSLTIAFSVIGVEQQVLFFDSLDIKEDDTSWGERVSMWSETLDKISSHPKEFLVGVGPDVPIRGPDVPVIKDLMFIESMQFQPASFHNFYIDVMFTMGVGFFVLMIAVILMTLKRLLVNIRLKDEIASDCFFATVGWLIMWNTHATGWSKPMFILVQLFALSHLVISGRLKGKET